MSRTWILTIPASQPWLNANGRRQPRHLAPVIRAWRDDAHQLARAAKLPRLGRAHILATLRFTDRRRRDGHNYYPTLKAVVDGLVDYGLLADDSSKFLDGPDIRIGEPVTRSPYGPSGEVVLTIREVA